MGKFLGSASCQGTMFSDCIGCSPNGSCRAATRPRNHAVQIATTASGALRATQADAEGDTASNQYLMVHVGCDIRYLRTTRQSRWSTNHRQLFLLCITNHKLELNTVSRTIGEKIWRCWFYGAAWRIGMPATIASTDATILLQPGACSREDPASTCRSLRRMTRRR